MVKKNFVKIQTDNQIKVLTIKRCCFKMQIQILCKNKPFQMWEEKGQHQISSKKWGVSRWYDLLWIDMSVHKRHHIWDCRIVIQLISSFIWIIRHRELLIIYYTTFIVFKTICKFPKCSSLQTFLQIQSEYHCVLSITIKPMKRKIKMALNAISFQWRVKSHTFISYRPSMFAIFIFFTAVCIIYNCNKGCHQ